MSAAAWEQALMEGCDALGLAADARRQAHLAAYVAELLRWNSKTNLTAITEPAEIVPKHLLDCLAAMPAAMPARVCDVGSGAGLPGLLWAREHPASTVVSIDARQRKTAFQAHIGRLWQLTNFDARHERVEEESEHFDLVTFRAFSALPHALALVETLLAPGGQIRALKGPGVEEELANIDADRWRYTMTPLAVPGLDAQRYVVDLWLRPS